MWLAATRSLCQSCCVLSLWNSISSHTSFLAAIKRERSLDRNSIRLRSTNNTSLCNNNLHRLGKTGPVSQFVLYPTQLFSCLTLQNLYFVILVKNFLITLNLQAIKSRERLFKERSPANELLNDGDLQ